MAQDYTLVVPPNIYRQMLEQARAELPNECCGLLAGKITDEPGQPPRGRVLACFPLINELASPVEFLSEGKSILQATRDMERRALDLLAIYHSHPTTDPIPSRKDRERSYYGPEVMNLIISLKEAAPRMAGWWLTTEEHREAKWEMRE